MARSLIVDSDIRSTAHYTTGQVAPTADALVLAFVANVKRPLTSGTLTTPRLSSPGLTWEVVDSVTTPDGERRLTCLRARGPAPAAGAVDIDFADQVQQLCAWSIVEYTDVDATGLNGSGAIGFSQPVRGSGARLDATFTPADKARDRAIGAILLAPTGQPSPVTPGAGFTEIGEETANQPLGKGLTLQTQDALAGTTTAAWTWTGDQNAVALIVGVKAPRAGGTTPPTGNPAIDLTRRYEPILHLHPSESFVPVNAKRYVEAAALWSAKAPFDTKGSWGAAPLAKAGTLAAAQNEPGKFLGTPDFVAAGSTKERFLEVGGWKNRDEVAEAGVSAGSSNVYVDRTEILRRYSTDLADSKYWYHTELFDTARLKALAAGTKGGFDLTATLANFANPLLLCYYFFYPAHEQSIGTDQCPNIEAKEFASHAGDWQCFALLLDGQGPPSLDTYTPQFFGITGSRPAPSTDGTRPARPHAFDPEGRVTIKVEPWRRGSASTPVQPDVLDDHPRFYIAHGSHSMYTTPGQHEVSPYPASSVPADCGKYDTPSAVPPASPGTPDIPAQKDSFTENGWVLILVKMRAGGILGPIGALVGLVAGIIEGIPKVGSPFGADGTPPFVPPPTDPPNPDAAPATAEQGITVRPRGLAIDDVTDRLFDWVSDQGVQSPSGRRYDFVVDRATQVWWPSDDGTKGFRGRWGQRVATDPVPHRAGVKFPEFWKMMLTALEQGFGEGTLPRPR